MHKIGLLLYIIDIESLLFKINCKMMCNFIRQVKSLHIKLIVLRKGKIVTCTGLDTFREILMSLDICLLFFIHTIHIAQNSDH